MAPLAEYVPNVQFRNGDCSVLCYTDPTKLACDQRFVLVRF